jgi:cytochrome P450
MAEANAVPDGRPDPASPAISAAAPAGAWPLLGHAPALLRDPLGFLGDAYSQGPVVRIRLGRTPAYLVNDAEAIRRILVTDAPGYDKGFQFDKLRVLIGDGVGTSTGDKHRRQRLLLRPAFDHAHVAGYLAEMTRCAVAEVDDWPVGGQVDAAAAARRLTMTIVSRSMFGSVSPAAAEILRSLPTLLGGVGLRALLPFRLIERFPTPANRRFEMARARLHVAVDQVVAEHRAATSGTDGDAPASAHASAPDLLGLLLAAIDEGDGSRMTDAQAHDEVMTILLAGTETAAGALGWALHLISLEPDLQAAVQAEVDALGPAAWMLRPSEELTAAAAAAAAATASSITVADLARLPLIRQILSEVLRLYPPGWVLGRRPVQDVLVGGVQIPAGTQLLLNFFGLHHDPRVFAEPSRFAPDRWRPDSPLAADPELLRTHYLPFGTGPRGCVGEPYSWSEMTVVLAVVFARFTLIPVQGQPVRPVARTTLHPDAVPLLLEPRR